MERTVTLFDHDTALGCDFLDRLEIRQGDRDAELDWTLRGAARRAVRIYRSSRGFTSDPAAADQDQALVYEGSAPATRLTGGAGDAGLAYRVSPDIAYYYSIFVRADDGVWRPQLRVRAEPRSVGRWRRPA